MTQSVAPYTEKYTSVSTLIANLKAQREKAMPLVRVPTDDLMKRPERPAAMSKQVPVQAGVAEVKIGATVRVGELKLTGKLVAVQPPSVEGGEARYRIGWLEGEAYREAGFWKEDFEVVAAKSR